MVAHIFAGSCRHDIAQTDPYQPTGMHTWYFGLVHLHPILHLIYCTSIYHSSIIQLGQDCGKIGPRSNGDLRCQKTEAGPEASASVASGASWAPRQ